MKLDVPTGTTYYWNPYSPKFYTIVQSPTLAGGYDSQYGYACSSDDEGSFCAGGHSAAGSFRKFASASTSSSSLRSPTEKHIPSKGFPSDDVYNLGWSTISSVRQEKTTDAQIATMVGRFPVKTLTAMAAVIENSPNLFLELCEKERGNVVSHVMAALNGKAGVEELVSMTAEHVFRLSTHQSGCIALTRIFDAISQEQQYAISQCLVQHFDALMCHQYGNFVLSRVAQTCSSDMVTAELLCCYFENPETLTTCLNDKFGSHVFEAFVKNCGAAHLFRILAVLFRDMDQLLIVATSRFSNYPLQAALRQMMALDAQHELSRWALATIPVLVADTKFATNINRAMGFGRTQEGTTTTMSQQQPQQHVRPQQRSRMQRAQ